MYSRLREVLIGDLVVSDNAPVILDLYDKSPMGSNSLWKFLCFIGHLTFICPTSKNNQVPSLQQLAQTTQDDNYPKLFYQAKLD